MANLVVPPYDIYADANGDPLEDGYVYIGIAGLSPINNPLQAYWDAALSIPANNIRTKGGYPSNSGTPGRLYTATNYSILVQDKRNVTVYQQLDSIDYFNSTGGSVMIPVDTIADLRGVVPITPNVQASVGGSVTIGDGLMGPLYYWNTLSGATDNGVSIIKPTSVTGAGRWLWINTNAPFEVVNISSTTTVTLEFKNRIFLVDTALATVVTVPDGDFQGQDIQIANKGVDTLALIGSGIDASTFVEDSVSLSWLGTEWSVTYRGDLSIANLAISGALTVDTIDEYTGSAGVTVENVLIKSGSLSGVTQLAVSGDVEFSEGIKLTNTNNIQHGSITEDNIRLALIVDMSLSDTMIVNGAIQIGADTIVVSYCSRPSSPADPSITLFGINVTTGLTTSVNLPEFGATLRYVSITW